MGAVEIITIVLSLVALSVTVIGFFASLKFYRDGMEMQSRAEKVLSTIEERASAIQTQVGDMFDKTLDAALGRSSSQEAQQQQSQMLKGPRRDQAAGPLPTAKAETTTGLAAHTELAQKAFQFYAFKQMRVSDVTDATARAVFNLGSPGGFNLLDGTAGLLFLGFFVDLEPTEVVARTRILFSNLEISYKRLGESLVDPVMRDQARRLLDQIAVELIVAETLDKHAIQRKIEEFQPTVRKVTVTVRSPKEVEDAVAEEFRRMAP